VCVCVLVGSDSELASPFVVGVIMVMFKTFRVDHDSNGSTFLRWKKGSVKLLVFTLMYCHQL